MGMPGPQKINRYGVDFKPKAVQMSNQPGVLIKDVAEPLAPSTHSFKYRLFYGTADEERVRYDNERGKGDHRHLGGKEEPYALLFHRSGAGRLRA